jgi:G3E family GTPase
MTRPADLRRLVTEWDLLLSSLQGAPAVPGQGSESRTPVTILAGFLGSGKTTMLRQLLQGGHGLKLAAVVNDVGAVNIDAAMIAQSGSDVIELTNGCSCCSLGPELGRGIDALATQTEPPDGILVEASGIADPAGIGAVVAGNVQVRLDGIITVIDAVALHSWLDNPATAPLFRRQLDAAHLLALNKIDLVESGGIEAATARLAELAPGRPVIPVEQGRLDPDVALGAALHGARPEPMHRPHEAGRFASKRIPVTGPMARGRLAAFLDNPPAGLLRVKGFVETLEDPGRQQSVQAVGRMWRIEPVVAGGGGKPVENNLILIGLADQVETWGRLSL